MKNESKPQKTSISVTKRAFSVVAVVAVLASLISVTALNDNISFASQGQGYQSGDLALYYSSDLDYTQYVTSAATGTYFALARTTNSTIDTIYAFNANTSPSYVLSNPNGGEYNRSGSYNGYNWKCTFYHRAYANVDNYVPYLIDNSLDVTGKAEYLIDKLIAEITPQPSPSPEAVQSINVSLPAGNILIADISNTGSNPYYLETTSGTSGAVVKPGMNNIQIGFTNTIPASFTVPNNSWDYPSWSGAGNASVLGTYNRQSTQGDFALSNTDALKYVIITNPMYPNDNNASANRLNSDLNITIDKVNSYVIYSLQTGYVSGNLIGTNDGSQYIDYEFDDETGEWVGTNQDGDPASPVWGGQNDFENTPTTVNDWLENIAHQISSFFSGAIGAITTLSVAVKNFSSTLMALYVWLPSPVLSILSSAVMLAIVIGVIKVFI